jgi:hypothetical protein
VAVPGKAVLALNRPVRGASSAREHVVHHCAAPVAAPAMLNG